MLVVAKPYTFNSLGGTYKLVKDLIKQGKVVNCGLFINAFDPIPPQALFGRPHLHKLNDVDIGKRNFLRLAIPVDSSCQYLQIAVRWLV